MAEADTTRTAGSAGPRRVVSDLDLNLLVALDALLRERNVTRAGTRIGLSQPTMSASLRKLRRFFDDELLVRVGRDFHLTPVARDLVEPVQHVLQLIQQAVDGPGPFDPAAAERTFRIMASDYTQLVLQPVIQQLSIEAPGVRIHFRSPDENTAGLLRKRQVDLAIMSRLGGFPSQTIYQDQWMCAFDRDHPDIGAHVTPAVFLSCPHVAFHVGRTGRSGAEHLLAAQGIDRHVAVTTDSFTASLFLLRGTRLLAIVQRRLGELLQEQAGIRLAPLPFPVPDLSSRMWWHPIDETDAAHQYLRSAIADFAATALAG